MTGYCSSAALAVIFAFAAPLGASALSFDQNVTPDVIFGDGNANGGFTVDTANGVEIGLRGKLRFDANDQPQNVFNSNGLGGYSFDAGNPPMGAGGAATPVWSFEWSINSNVDGSGGMLDQFTYLLELDGDPGAGTDFGSFDPINAPFFDHAIGDNTTGNGDGVAATSIAEYSALIAANNVAQNSWRYDFFNTTMTQLSAFDPNESGVYTIRLSAFDGQTALASSSIDIRVGAVPLPATLPLLLAGIGGLALLRRRRTA